MARRQFLVGEKIPFDDHIEEDGGPATVVTKNNSVFATYAVAGVYPDTADDIDLEAWAREIHNAELNIAAEDVELFLYKCRGYASPENFPTPEHSRSFPRKLDADYRESLFGNTLYENRIFLAVQVHSPTLAAQHVTQFLKDLPTDPRPGIKERESRLNEICDLLESQLSRFGFRRLGYREDPETGFLFDEIAEAYVFAATGQWRPIPATTGRMGNAMVSEDVRFKWRHIEIDGAGDTTHAVMFALKNYPMSTAPWMLHPIDKANYRCTLIQSYRFLSNAAAGGAIDRKQNKMFLAGDKAKDQEAELSRAHNRLLNREFVIGNHILMVLAFSDSRRWRNRVSGAVWRDLAYCGLQAMPIRGILGAAFLSAFPGNDAWKPRPGYINSINFGAFAPLYGWPKGDEKGNVDGPEIALFRTLAGTPYRYHWARDTGGTLLATNTLVTGESGSGKTTLIGFLIALSASRFRIMALAHKGGWKPLFEHLGGAYAALGDRVPHISALKAFSPTPANMEFLLELLRTCIGGTMTEEEGRRLALGLNTIKHELPIEEQCLAELRPFFDNTPEGAGARLEKWIWPTGELGWVIDAPQHTIKITDLCCYDTTALMDNMRARGPALACVFHEINLALDGTPTLIPIDEGWRSLIEEQTRNFIATELRMIRSKGGTLVFMTQSARDISDSGIANLLIEMCPNAFHMANPRGRREHYVDGLGLTDGQFDAFHGLQSGQGLFLLLQDHGARSVLAQAPFPQEIEHYLSILSPSELELRSEELEEYLEAAE